MPQYEQMTDEQLIRRLREGDRAITDYLMEKYKGLVKKEAKAMYLLGGENDDLIQEGMIGLFKAVQDYDLEQMYVDSFLKVANLEGEDLTDALTQLNQISEQFKVNFCLSISVEEKDPSDRTACAVYGAVSIE